MDLQIDILLNRRIPQFQLVRQKYAEKLPFFGEAEEHLPIPPTGGKGVGLIYPGKPGKAVGPFLL